LTNLEKGSNQTENWNFIARGERTTLSERFLLSSRPDPIKNDHVIQMASKKGAVAENFRIPPSKLEFSEFAQQSDHFSANP
jgi:hypothetical protein